MAKTHIALDVSHVDQAVRFYQAFLGVARFPYSQTMRNFCWRSRP